MFNVLLYRCSLWCVRYKGALVGCGNRGNSWLRVKGDKGWMIL